MEAACLALETLCEVYPEWWNAVATTLARPPGTPLAIRFSHFAFKVEDPAMKAVTRRVATDLIEQASTDAKAGRVRLGILHLRMLLPYAACPTQSRARAPPSSKGSAPIATKVGRFAFVC